MGSGHNRSVLSFNDVLPGPTLYVCEGDKVEVTLENHIQDGPITNADGSPNTTTIHFHGIREVGFSNQTKFGPWSDGVPYVNQCPVKYKESFRYFFHATRENMNAPPGTYWYHSHVGAQRTNGLEGVLVIREKSYTESQRDRDLVVALQEWYDSPTCQVPISILVNGKGRIADKKFDCRNANELNKYERGIGGIFEKVEYLPTKNGEFTTNYESFKVDFSGTYRLRIAGLIGQNFPIRTSAVFCCLYVEDPNGAKCSEPLNLTAIAADSLDIEPVRNVNYVWVASGERFDIEIETTSLNCPITHLAQQYIKLNFIGSTNLFPQFRSLHYNTSVCSNAFLTTDGEVPDLDYVHSHNCTEHYSNYSNIFPDNVRTLNPPSKTYSMFSQRIRNPHLDVDSKGYIYPVDITSKNHVPTWDVIETTFIEFTNVSTFNNIRTTWPSVPYLHQNPSLSRTYKRCNHTNKDQFEHSFTSINIFKNETETSETKLTTTISVCDHVLQYPYQPGKWVETVLINLDDGANHPIHQHGGWYWVVGEGQFDTNGSLLHSSVVREGLKDGTLKRNTTNSSWYGDSLTALPKDVIQVPNHGYVVIRTPLDNPGNWIFHCHIDFHLSIGMGLGEGYFKFFALVFFQARPVSFNAF